MIGFLKKALLASTVAATLISSSPFNVKADDVSGAINGFVFGASLGRHWEKIPLKNVTVFAYEEGNSIPVGRRTTDRNGFYAFLGLLPGRYTIAARGTGFYGDCYPRAVVVPGSLSRINVVSENPRAIDHCRYAAWPDEGVYF